jgi:hypothetical protein
MVLLGMALIKSDSEAEKPKTEGAPEAERDNDGTPTLEELVFRTSVAVAPIILPMIESLGGLNEEQFVVGSQVGDDE